MNTELDFRVLDPESEEVCKSVADLELAAGWIKSGEGSDEIAAMLRNSFICVGAYAGGEMAGFARVLSDGVDIAYFVDFTVSPRYRRRGIGTRMCRFLIDRLKEMGFSEILCISTPEARNVYSKVGTPLDGCIPVRFM